MNARKDRLKSLFSGEGQQTPSPASVPAGVPADEPPKRATSAAVKAMGLSLGNLSQEVEDARRLRDALASGDRVVEIDTALIERSPYLDRLSEGAANDEDFEALKQSIAEHGQQVPVLVRPHPDGEKAARGMYQIAYGHRRVQAARQLNRSARAVVRALNDDELALAQGKENAERRALSFIERAFFAQTLLENGFDRVTAQAALGVHKSEMSRLLQVAQAVPRHVVKAIGPAPKAGRPRWLELGELIAKDSAGFVADELSQDGFRASDSDTRFQLLFDRLKASAQRREGARSRSRVMKIAGTGGKSIGELSKAPRGSRLTVPESAGRGFADYVAGRLPELYEAFSKAESDVKK